jgi:polysaccharide biosynthesis protein PslH
MQILFVALSLPFPSVSGHRLRMWSLLKGLAADGHSITLLSFLEPGETVQEPLRAVCKRIETEPVPGLGGGALDRLRSLVSPIPHGAWRFRSRPLREKLRTLVAGGGFDLVICDGVYNMPNLPDCGSTPVLLNKDDVAHVIFKRFAQVESNPLRRIYGLIEAAKLRRFERQAGDRVDGLLACSEVDAVLLRELCPDCPVEVVPNVVDTDHYRPVPGEQPGVVLFQGSMDWYPNRDGALWFAREVFPHVRRRQPTAVFRIAGRQPAAELRQELEQLQGVEVRGEVADMRDEIAQAQVCVVPLRIGSGTRLKILEAAALGKPIVSTSLGAEGLDFATGEEIVIAERGPDIAEEVVRLLGNRERREALGAAARRRVEGSYGMGSLQSALRAALQSGSGSGRVICA